MTAHRVPPRQDGPTSRPLVFLDIDGVLSHFSSDEELDPRCLRLLDELLARTGAGVVICSGWRERFSVGQLRTIFAAAGLRGEVLGATPILPGKTRRMEIEAYLSKLPARPPLVILDDVPVGLPLYDRQVVVDDFRGLTVEDVQRAEELLSAAPR